MTNLGHFFLDLELSVTGHSNIFCWESYQFYKPVFVKIHVFRFAGNWYCLPVSMRCMFAYLCTVYRSHFLQDIHFTWNFSTRRDFELYSNSECSFSINCHCFFFIFDCVWMIFVWWAIVSTPLRFICRIKHLAIILLISRLSHDLNCLLRLCKSWILVTLSYFSVNVENCFCRVRGLCDNACAR